MVELLPWGEIKLDCNKPVKTCSVHTLRVCSWISSDLTQEVRSSGVQSTCKHGLLPDQDPMFITCIVELLRGVHAPAPNPAGTECAVDIAHLIYHVQTWSKLATSSCRCSCAASVCCTSPNRSSCCHLVITGEWQCPSAGSQLGRDVGPRKGQGMLKKLKQLWLLINHSRYQMCS